MERNNIQDITPLQKLMKLKRLDLGNNHIKNIYAVSKLTNLEELSLRRNNITSLNAEGVRSEKMRFFSGVVDLFMSDKDAEDLKNRSHLLKLEKLQILDLSGNHIQDVRFLTGMKGLKKGDLRNNPVENAELLTKRKGLKCFAGSDDEDIEIVIPI